MISASSFKNFVHRIVADKAREKAPGTERELHELDNYRRALDQRTESNVDDIQAAFNKKSRTASRLQGGIAAVGVVGSVIGGAALLGVLAIPAAALYGAVAVTGLALVGAEIACSSYVANADYAAQTEQFKQEYQEHHQAEPEPMGYLLAGRVAQRGLAGART